MPDSFDNLLRQLGDEFADVATARLEQGAEEYGETGFLENDMFTFLLEELVDVANYARFMYIKIRILQEVAHARGIDLTAGTLGPVREDHGLPFGPSSFIRVDEVFGLLSAEEIGRRLRDSG